MKKDLSHFYCNICLAEQALPTNMELPEKWVQVKLKSDVHRAGGHTETKHLCEKHFKELQKWFAERQTYCYECHSVVDVAVMYDEYPMCRKCREKAQATYLRGYDNNRNELEEIDGDYNDE